MLLRIVLFSIAALLLGAHFVRAGNMPMVGLCLLAPLLFLLKRRWSIYFLQFLAYAGAGIWVSVAMTIVELRLKFGQPWVSAAVILGAASLFTLLAGVSLNSLVIRQRYP